MSTPTPSTIGASPASKKSIHNNVATPIAHNLSSPAPPRSVPSPATTRKDQAGKTPINHATTGSSQGSKTVGGSTPMMLNLSQQGTASPMPGSLAGLTPTGLGVDLGTLGQLNVATSALGSSMMRSISDFGMTTSGRLKRNEDEERRAKMRKILKTIGRPKGRVSEEGIARVSRRAGFANDIDAEKLSAEERERRVGNRTISIAGNTIVIDVDMKNHVPKNVQIVFSNDLASAGDQADRAGHILLNNLTAKTSSPMNKMLDDFALNLNRLARLDRLSSIKVNCFDALSGVYASLSSLYDQELKLAEALYAQKSAPARSSEAQDHVISRKSGRPAIHENEKLGLSITYWQGHKFTKQEPKVEDTNGQAQEWSKSVDTNCRIWLETERCHSTLYPSIRTTDTWLPKPLELSTAEDGSTSIPWHNPDMPYHAPNGNVVADESTQILPDVRFVAKLEPPIILPFQVAHSIFEATGSTMPTAYQQPSSYLGLLLKLPETVATSGQLDCESEISRPSDDGFVTAKHNYHICVGKHDAGFKLEELPFSHPRQIVELLPVLRQWVAFGDLLLRQLNASAGVMPARPKSVEVDNSGIELTLESLTSDKWLPSTRADVHVDGALLTTPVPALMLNFPLLDGALCSAELHVASNGQLELNDSSIKIKNAAKALDLCNDLGVWIEWMRSQSPAL